MPKFEKLVIIVITLSFHITGRNSQILNDYYSEGLQKHDFAQLISMATEFLNLFPNTDLYFLGQSLAWIGKTIEIMNKFNPTSVYVHYVPFSGSFLQPVGSTNSYTINDADANFPNEEEIKSYESLLRAIGLSPKAILSRYEVSGRRTVIADYIFEGKGMASFMYILKKWEERKSVNLDKALEVAVLTDSRDYYERMDHVLKIKYVEITVKLTTIFRDDEVLDRIRHPEDLLGFERLVVPFRHDDWTKKSLNPTLEDLPYNVELIRNLTLFVENYFSLWSDFEDLLQIAEHISSTCVQSDIFFLDDLAWVGKTLETFSSSGPRYISFSRNFTSSSPVPGLDTFEFWDLPTEEESIYYRHFLQRNGLDPRVIYLVFMGFGRRTVIAGNGLSEYKLASLLYFLFRWAEEEGINLNFAIGAYVAGSRLRFLNLNNEFIVPCVQLGNHYRVLDRLASSNDPDFVQLIQYFPPSSWSGSLETYDDDHLERVLSMDEMLKTFLHGQLNERRKISTSTLPTLVLRTESNGNLLYDMETIALYGPCTSSQRRYKRNFNSTADEKIDLNKKLSLLFTFNDHSSDTFNMNVFQKLNTEYDKGSRNISFVKFIEKELKNPISNASKILLQVCDSYLMFCSDKKILSTLDCTNNLFSYLNQIILAFFGQPFEYENFALPHGPELVYV